jgi:hypothetical protein
MSTIGMISIAMSTIGMISIVMSTIGMISIAMSTIGFEVNKVPWQILQKEFVVSIINRMNNLK